MWGVDTSLLCITPVPDAALGIRETLASAPVIPFSLLHDSQL